MQHALHCQLAISMNYSLGVCNPPLLSPYPIPPTHFRKQAGNLSSLVIQSKDHNNIIFSEVDSAAQEGWEITLCVRFSST